MSKNKRTRFYEILPGTLIWLAFLLSIVLSFIKPIWVIYFIIAFDLFWLFRVAHFTVLLNFSWKQYKIASQKNWLAEIKEIEDWKRIYHYVILPTAGEPFEVLDSTLNSLVKNKYPLNKFIVHLAGEERFLDSFEIIAKKITDKYGSKFFKLITTVHPDNVVGEIKGKGANAHYAGHQAKKMIDEWGIAYEDIICSYFDSDTCVHPKYFTNLTYKYLTTPNPTRKAYQPAVVYNNNIWDSSIVTRITAFGTVFWLMSELVRPERMYTFSSHSMPFKALVDIGFWQKDVVSDDSRIFLQGFFRYQGDFTVVPLYIPVSMDTVMAETFWQSSKNLYKQQRRWAWGAENFPYIMENFKKYPQVSKWLKFKYAFNLMEGLFFWATAPILIFLLGQLPLYIAGLRPESSSVLVQNAPFVLQWLMTFAMLGILVSAIFSIKLLPPRPHSQPRRKWLTMFLQWLLLPITLILFGSIPATDAQTRLMLGGKFRLGFWVTPKKRK